MRNSICMLSFPISHIVFLQKMYVVLIGLGVCFFVKRVHILVKDFKDYQSLLSLSKSSLHFKDYQSLLSRLSTSSLHFKDYQSLLSRLSKSSLLFKDYQSLLSRLSKSSLHFKDYHSLLSRLSTSSLHFKDYQSLLSRLSTSSLLFKDYQSLLSRLSMSSLHFKGYHSLLSRLSMSSLHSKDYQSLLSRLQCLLYILRTSISFVKASASSLHFKTSKSFVWCTWYFIHFFHLTGFTTRVFANCRSDSKIVGMKLVFLSSLTFSFSIKDK